MDIHVNGFRARTYPYGYSRSLSRYIDVRTDIRADIYVELSVLRTVQPGNTL